MELEDILMNSNDKYELLGNLIPKGKITLLHGASGSGKTYSLLKFLNSNYIEPYFIDFDDNTIYKDKFKFIHIDGYKLVNHLFNKESINDLSNILRNKVVVIDTYALANNAIRAKKEEYNIDINYGVDNLCKTLQSFEVTVIILAHTKYYAGKQQEPDCSFVFANHVACRLHLVNIEKIDSRTKDKQIKRTSYLEIEKLRGYDGERIIKDWMR